MIPSPACLALVQQFEGCATLQSDGTYKAYPDPGTGGEPWTIGWGTTGPYVGPDTVWTKDQCDDHFWHDLVRFAFDISEHVDIVAPPPHDDDLPGSAEGRPRETVTTLIGAAPTTQPQFDAMVSFAYNVGLGNLKTSTLLKKHIAGDYAGAAAEFAKWNHSAGKVLAGLTRRRAAEAEMYASAT